MSGTEASMVPALSEGGAPRQSLPSTERPAWVAEAEAPSTFALMPAVMHAGRLREAIEAPSSSTRLAAREPSRESLIPLVQGARFLWAPVKVPEPSSPAIGLETELPRAAGAMPLQESPLPQAERPAPGGAGDSRAFGVVRDDAGVAERRTVADSRRRSNSRIEVSPTTLALCPPHELGRCARDPAPPRCAAARAKRRSSVRPDASKVLNMTVRAAPALPPELPQPIEDFAQ